MTLPMANKRTSSREKFNVEDNKRRDGAQPRTSSDQNKWQQMRDNYEAIVLEDHSFSEQYDREFSLWQLHYKRFEEFRVLLNSALASAGSAVPQNGKHPAGSELDRIANIRSQFKTFLSEATGFYHDLMLKIRAKYGLPLGYLSDDTNNQISTSKDGDKNSEGNMGLISCQRCLIYLGDLARYKALYAEGDAKARDFTAASSYYMQALSLCPSNGNPHHQLAILAGYLNDELALIYRYFRSLAIDNPFVTARDNLIIAFEKNRQNYIQLIDNAEAPIVKTPPPKVSGKGRGKGNSRPSANDVPPETNAVKVRSSSCVYPSKAFITRFLRLNGILFTRISLETFVHVFSTVKNDLLELLSSGTEERFNFGSDIAECRLAMVRMIAILIFTVHNIIRESESQSYADMLQRSVLVQNAFTATFEFMGCIVERCSQLNDPSSSYLLPGIMVFVEWLACHHDVAIGMELVEEQVNARSFFWKNCIALLNKLITKGYVNTSELEDGTCFSNMSKYDENETTNRLALFEDFELRGFTPLRPAQLILDFSRKNSSVTDGSKHENIARVQRIVAAVKALTNVVLIVEDGIFFDVQSKTFVVGIEPQVSDDYPSSCLLEPVSNGGLPLNSCEVQINLDSFSKPEITIGAEDEDEDEVIVFRPSISETHAEKIYTKVDQPRVPASVSGIDGSFAIGRDNYSLQNSLNMDMRHPTVTAGSDTQHMLPIQPSFSKYPASVSNGLAHSNLMANGTSQKSEVPYLNFVMTNGGLDYSSRVPQFCVPSEYDNNMPIGATSEGVAVRPCSAMPLGLKKNPASRPVRHIGPPPGFAPVVKSVVPQMENYRGYQLALSSQNINQMGETMSSKSNGCHEVSLPW